ncbi:Methane oxygenase PmoA [Spirosomataceae bacterium TFI 002]|nr:Methane oxygenase PmoA [Spirosomataceae bacterium TFI 002]
MSVPSQYNSEDKTMNFIIAPSSNNKRKLTLCNLQDQSNLGKVNIFKDQSNVSFTSKNSTILTYVNGMQAAPEGKSELYAKSGFIHPLYSPNGTRLTRIQPSDHYHHYGIWGPWTKTTIEGEHIDFWNLNDGTGTVLFNSFKKYEKGNAYSSIKAIQHHNNLKSNETAIVEELEIKTWNVNGVYLVDYNSTFSSPLKNGILFDAYRYGGGIGFRGTEKWGTANSSILTSEGKTRLDADGNNAKWCIIEGESEVPNQRSGILIMSHPNNRSHPEPMRVWPEDTYEGKGNVFLEFCPIRHVEWKIEPNKNYQLKYRMLVFDGHLSPSEAEAHWQAFANQDNINLN